MQNKRTSDLIKILEVEKIQEYEKWIKEIPFFKFPEDWEVQIIPPITGAIVRFKVRREKNKEISIYLDCYERLGTLNNKPYWEVYPYKEDVYRCSIFEIEELFEIISRALGNKRKKLTKN